MCYSINNITLYHWFLTWINLLLLVLRGILCRKNFSWRGRCRPGYYILVPWVLFECLNVPWVIKSFINVPWVRLNYNSTLIQISFVVITFNLRADRLPHLLLCFIWSMYFPPTITGTHVHQVNLVKSHRKIFRGTIIVFRLTQGTIIILCSTQGIILINESTLGT